MTSEAGKPRFGADYFFAAIDHMSKRLDLLNGKVKELQEENKALRAQTPEPDLTYLKNAPWPDVITRIVDEREGSANEIIVGYTLKRGKYDARQLITELRKHDEHYMRLCNALNFIRSATEVKQYMDPRFEAEELRALLRHIRTAVEGVTRE